MTLAPIGISEITAGLLVASLNAYVLMGGADYGGGVWDLLASGPRRREQRALIASTIGPIWEANHVWLIIAVVMLFTAFPPAFAMISTVLHVPLTALLVGIVLRGSAFVFRSYGPRSVVHGPSSGWGRVFAIASTITPFLLGTTIGAVATGAVGVAASHTDGGSFASVYIDPWLAPFPLAVGAMALALFALLAAVYLTCEAHDAGVREDFRRRGLVAALATFVAAFGALGIARRDAPRMSMWLTSTPWAAGFHVATGLAALVVIWALWSRRYPAARVAAITQLSLILWGWAFAQYPWMVPPTLSIRAAAAPPATMQLLLGALSLGALILVPSLVCLFRTFSSRVAADGSG